MSSTSQPLVSATSPITVAPMVEPTSGRIAKKAIWTASGTANGIPSRLMTMNETKPASRATANTPAT